MRFAGPPASEELRIRRRAFVERIVLSLDAAAEDFSEDENVRSENARRQTPITRNCEMKFYDCSTAPSPRRVRIFLAEKGISVPTVQVDLRNNEQFSAAVPRHQSGGHGAGARTR